MKIRVLSIGGAFAGGLVVGAFCLFPALGHLSNEIFVLVPDLDLYHVDQALMYLVVVALIAGCLGGPLIGLLGAALKKGSVYLVGTAVAMFFALILLYCWVRTVFFQGLALRPIEYVLEALGSPYFWLLTGMVVLEIVQTGLYAVAALFAFKGRSIRSTAEKDSVLAVREDNIS